MPNQNL